MLFGYYQNKFSTDLARKSVRQKNVSCIAERFKVLFFRTRSRPWPEVIAQSLVTSIVIAMCKRSAVNFKATYLRICYVTYVSYSPAFAEVNATSAEITAPAAPMSQSPGRGWLPSRKRQPFWKTMRGEACHISSFK